jgi:hypothetical protein
MTRKRRLERGQLQISGLGIIFLLKKLIGTAAKLVSKKTVITIKIYVYLFCLGSSLKLDLFLKAVNIQMITTTNHISDERN